MQHKLVNKVGNLTRGFTNRVHELLPETRIALRQPLLKVRIAPLSVTYVVNTNHKKTVLSDSF